MYKTSASVIYLTGLLCGWNQIKALCKVRHTVLLVYHKRYFHTDITYFVSLKEDEVNLSNDFYFSGICSSWIPDYKIETASFIGSNNWIQSLTCSSFTDFLLKKNIWSDSLRSKVKAIHWQVFFHCYSFLLLTFWSSYYAINCADMVLNSQSSQSRWHEDIKLTIPLMNI